MDEFLTEKEAAALCGKRPRTLEFWRWQRRGPPFYSIGHSVRYKRTDIVAFLEKQCRVETNGAPIRPTKGRQKAAA